ncbi:MAG TPA: hypothetical protein VND94_09610 [Terriglobia bacterium]|nr:hypothetical protein [Terriglobia bacterium]
MARIASPLIIAAFLASTGSAIADDLYRGTWTDKDRPVPVILTLQPASYPGDPAGEIRFGQPWACGLKLEFSGASEQKRIYSFVDAGAGACMALTLGYFQSVAADGGLEVEFFNQKQVSQQKVLLKLVPQ